MRTTLELDDDVLAAAKELGRRQRRTAGQVISELSRRALSGAAAASAKSKRGTVAGFKPFASRGGVVTNAQIDRLRNESGA